MNSTRQCSDLRLRQLIEGDESNPEYQSSLRHIDSCASCQTRLEQLAADSGVWQEARDVLTSADGVEPAGSDSPANRWRNSNRQRRPVAWNETMARHLLSPPSHPEMLGRIGRYDVERLIGSGGMGVVFKAWDTELNRPVAVKLLAPYLAENGSARKRFAREARAAAAVVDEHVVAIHNVESGGDPEKPPFLVMKYIAGGSLQQRLDRDGPLDVCEILRIGMQTARGLAAAHAQGLIHRDVKPSNILLDEGVERALLTDFGLARAEDDACLTRSGFHPGTPHYMSPEQVRGEPIDGRSDLFSLGCVLYAMCTGHPPFRAETSYAVLRRITDDAARPIRELNPDIPEWLERIVMKLLSKSREDRFDSAEQVAELLEDCLAHVQHPTTTPLPASVVAVSPRRVRRPMWVKAIAGAVTTFSLILAGVLIVLELNKGTLRIESNSEIDVPIRIVHGEKVVKELTVSQEGTITQLHAGQYRIEVDGEGTGIEISGDSVILKRGEIWIAKIDVHSEPAKAMPAGEGNPKFPSSLPDVVKQFNRKMEAAMSNSQPPLTVDELLSFCLWNLQTDGQLSAEKTDLLTNVGIGHRLPEQWTIEGGDSQTVTDDGAIDIYQIQLVNRYSNTQVLVRKRYYSPPLSFRVAAVLEHEESATPLTAAITEFNAMHNRVDGIRQPPLTIDEVLAAIVDWNSRRDEAAVDNKTFANFQEIARTHQLASDIKLEVLSNFVFHEGDSFKIWSVRIRMPQVAKAGWTNAFEIRKQYISVDSIDNSVIQWGKPNDNGLQAGFRLIPSQRSYQVGQQIKTEFFYRSISGKSIDATMPNLFSHRKLIGHDSEGHGLEVVEVRDMTIGGWVKTGIGESLTRKPGQPLRLCYITPTPSLDIRERDPGETWLKVADGQKLFLTYIVSDLNDGSLHTGEVVIDIVGQKSSPER